MDNAGKTIYSISIHTLCEEGDFQNGFFYINLQISIHTLCEEGDILGRYIIILSVPFQSTPSVKRATLGKLIAPIRQTISIHTLCEEGDINHS